MPELVAVSDEDNFSVGLYKDGAFADGGKGDFFNPETVFTIGKILGFRVGFVTIDADESFSYRNGGWPETLEEFSDVTWVYE